MNIPSYIEGGHAPKGKAIVGEIGVELVYDDAMYAELAAIKYPIKPNACWQMKQRMEYLRKLYIERLKNENSNNNN